MKREDPAQAEWVRPDFPGPTSGSSPCYTVPIRSCGKAMRTALDGRRWLDERGRSVALMVLTWCTTLLCCVRAGFEPGRRPDDSAIDGPVGARDSGDSAAPDTSARACDWTGSVRFGEPEPLSELNGPDYDGEPVISADGLTITFSSARAGTRGRDLFQARASTPHGTFDAPLLLDELNTTANEIQLRVAPDGLTAYLVTDRAGGSGAFDIWVATRSSVSQAFSNAMFAPLPAVGTAFHEYDPWSSADGLRLYFARARPGQSESQLLLAARASPQTAFSPGDAITGVDDPAAQGNPALTEDELVIVFNSIRAGGAGDFDLW